MTADDWILAVDQGTHASRALLFDGVGAVRYATLRSVNLNRRDGVRVEQDAAELVDSVRAVVADVLGHASKHGISVTAAGLATQRSTVVAWDRETGEPLHNALSWQDTRAQSQLRRFGARATDVEAITGLQLSPHYGVSKLRWLVEEVPAVAAAARDGRLMMGPLAAYLLFHLVAGSPRCCDAVNAARTLLCDVRRGDWAPSLLRAGELQAEWLPHVRPVLHDYGVLGDTGIPVHAVNGDQNAALCARGEPSDRWIAVNAGSGAFVARSQALPEGEAAPLLLGVLWSNATQARYLVEGTVNGAGSALAWARQEWSLPAPEAVLSDWPECPNGPPLFLNSVGGLGSPWWMSGVVSKWLEPADAFSPSCRLAGVAESVLFLIYANLALLQRRAPETEGIVLSGGLSRGDGWCQRLADLTGLPVVRSAVAEATARGIAWLAAGRPDQWEPGRAERFLPRPDKSLRDRYTRFMAAIERATGRVTGH